MKTNTESQSARIVFLLQQDEDGYPPAGSERVWATRNDNTFTIDNIPFFAQGVSLGDVVRANEVNGELIYESTVSYSGHSTFRFIFFEQEYLQQVRQELTAMGCSSEKSHLENLISVDVPPEVSMLEFREFLAKYVREEIIDFEEAAIFD